MISSDLIVWAFVLWSYLLWLFLTFRLAFCQIEWRSLRMKIFLSEIWFNATLGQAKCGHLDKMRSLSDYNIEKITVNSGEAKHHSLYAIIVFYGTSINFSSLQWYFTCFVLFLLIIIIILLLWDNWKYKIRLVVKICSLSLAVSGFAWLSWTE